MESENTSEHTTLSSDASYAATSPAEGTGDAEHSVTPKGRLKGVAALKLHLSLLFGLALCAVAFRFELSRAIGGNSLSWAYVGEWPFFAGFGIYFWWFILNGRERRPKKTDQATVAPEFANMAAQWQDEQRRLLEQQLSPSDRLVTHEADEDRLTDEPDEETAG